MNNENRPSSPQKEMVLRHSPFLRELLTFEGQGDERWQRIGVEARGVRHKIDMQHGKNWGHLALRPFIQIPERMGLYNPELGTTLNRDITIGLVYAGYEVENISNLEMIIDEMYEVLRKDRFIWQPSIDVDPQTHAIKRGLMDVFIGEALDEGLFLRGGARLGEFKQPPAQLPPVSDGIVSYIESLDLTDI